MKLSDIILFIETEMLKHANNIANKDKVVKDVMVQTMKYTQGRNNPTIIRDYVTTVYYNTYYD